MNTKSRSTGVATAWVLLVTLLLTASMVVYSAAPASADDKQEAAQLVEKARFAFESFMTDGKMGPFQGLVKRARGVFIAPQLLKGAFIIGVSGGSGVLVVQDEKAGQWNGPSFYTIGGASFGFQIGGEASEVVLLAMTERGVSSLLWSSFKLGAEAGLAAGPVGMGVSAASVNLSVDILSFSRSKGLYGGISLDGAVVATRGDWNEAYYGKPLTPTDILIRKTVINPQAQRLMESVAKAAAEK